MKLQYFGHLMRRADSMGLSSNRYLSSNRHSNHLEYFHIYFIIALSKQSSRVTEEYGIKQGKD